jgi:hypothetical protein
MHKLDNLFILRAGKLRAELEKKNKRLYLDGCSFVTIFIIAKD